MDTGRRQIEAPRATPARLPQALWWIVVALLVASIVFVQFDLGRYFTFDTLERTRGELLALYRARPTATLVFVFVVYVVVNALPVPGVLPLTLVAGAVLGVVAGVLVVSFASALGATLAFVVARHLLRDAVRRRFAARLAAIDDGVRRDGAWYVVALHAAPLMPGFLINLLAGLTPMTVRRYYAATQLGMLPGIVVWVNAGTQLAAIERVTDVLSPGVLGSLMLLALLPLAMPRLLARRRRRAGREPAGR